MAEVNSKRESYELDDNVTAERTGFLHDVEHEASNRQNEYETSTVQEKPSAGVVRSTAFLDGVRGMAALWVFNQHFMGGGEHSHGFGENGNYYFVALPFFRILYDGGEAAVALFFVLSGFVLSQTSVKLFHKGQYANCRKSLLSAAVRRPFRLYLPCLGVSLLVAMLMHVPNGFYPDLPWSKPQESIFMEVPHWFMQCMRYLNPFQRHGSDRAWFQYDLVLWTIPIELKGSYLIYLMAPVCCFAIVSQIWAVAILAVTVVVTMQIGWWMGACFLMGLILTIIEVYQLDAPLLERLKPRTRTITLNVLFVIGFYLVAEPAIAGHRAWALETPGWYYLQSAVPDVYDEGQYYRYWNSYGSLLFVYGVLRLKWLQWFFSTRPLRYLGKVSFMLYLIHLPIFYCFGDRFNRVWGIVGFGSEPKWWDSILWLPEWGFIKFNVRVLVAWAAMLSICLSVAHLLTKVVDDPSVTLGKRLSRRLGLELPPASSSRASTTEGEQLPSTSHRLQ